jgi:hypothetical protein
VTYRDTFPGGPVGFFGDITQKSYATKHALYLLQTLLADGVVVGSHFYRSSSGLIEMNCVIKDLSLFCRLANRLGHHHTKLTVVRLRRSGHNFS